MEAYAEWAFRTSLTILAVLFVSLVSAASIIWAAAIAGNEVHRGVWPLHDIVYDVQLEVSFVHSRGVFLPLLIIGVITLIEVCRFLSRYQYRSLKWTKAAKLLEIDELTSGWNARSSDKMTAFEAGLDKASQYDMSRGKPAQTSIPLGYDSHSSKENSSPVDYGTHDRSQFN